MLSYRPLNDTADIVVPHSPCETGRYRRMFRHLPPWAPDGRTDQEKRVSLEKLAQVMIQASEQAEDTSLDNPSIPAGYTFFFQFMAHDMTFDPTSYIQRLNDPNQLCDFRVPRLDLASLYGGGPMHSPFLYDQARQDQDGLTGFLLVGHGENEAEEDLPRNPQGRTYSGDIRNDETIILSQLQLGLMKFHNQIMSALDAEGIRGIQAFLEAQRLVRWHYQWVMVHDFLTRLLNPDVITHLMTPRTRPQRDSLQFYRLTTQPFIPLEFSAAAYRTGHSMIRASYALNDMLEDIRDHVGIGGKIPIVPTNRGHPNPLADLSGGKFLPRIWTLQWNRFLDFAPPSENQSTRQQSRKFHPELTASLAMLPTGLSRQTGLTRLNLTRGWRLGLPSGQHVSRAMGIAPLYNPSGHDPLWYYLLQEAALGGGEQLGPVGSTIVGEVVLGLLMSDPQSYLNVNPTWKPQNEVVLPLASPADEDFQLRDILRFAKVSITKEDIDTIFT